MGENSTILNALTTQAMVKGEEVTECADADEIIFFYSMRAELDRLMKKPRQQTIDKILEYSRTRR